MKFSGVTILYRGRASVNGSTGVIYAKKFGQNAQN